MNTGIKKHIANYFFKKELSKLNRDKIVCNIDKAKSIAILYNAIDEHTQESVNKLVRFFQEKQKMRRGAAGGSEGSWLEISRLGTGE